MKLGDGSTFLADMGTVLLFWEKRPKSEAYSESRGR